MNKLYLKIKQSGFGFIMRSKNLTKSYIHFEDFYNSRELACKKGFTIFLILPGLLSEAACAMKSLVPPEAWSLPSPELSHHYSYYSTLLFCLLKSFFG